MAKAKKKPTLTNNEKLNVAMLVMAKKLLKHYENDIESGIEDGIYDEDDNKETRAFIKRCKETFKEFSKQRECIFIHISGGNLQSIGATCEMDVEVFDLDNYDATDNKKDYRNGQTPEQWDKMIKKLKNKGEIKPVW